ncbi:MAG: hypothetical protein WCB19_00375 [Thermoplasmata archaeon]
MPHGSHAETHAAAQAVAPREPYPDAAAGAGGRWRTGEVVAGLIRR